jgi:Arc/MetJ-type ribon-helix-helix transcriptional regulator
MATLSFENERFIEQAVSVGLYHSRDEAIDRAVELLRHQRQLIRDVDEGIAQLERGEGVPLDIAAVKTAVRERLKAR